MAGNSIRISSVAEIDSAAKKFLEEVSGHKLLAFYGEMGAGKTTFTVALCKALGVSDSVCSPTFTIVNEYLGRDGRSIYHFDFYRIKNDAEALDIGIEDYFYSGNLCIMEWPENVANLLPDDTLRVRITVEDDGTRVLTW